MRGHGQAWRDGARPGWVARVTPAAALAAVALVVSGCGPVNGHHADTTSSSTPTVSVTPTPTSTAPAGPPSRVDQIDDATVVARLSAPRTGEVWTSPKLDESKRAILGFPDDPYAEPYLVGHRGTSQVYAVVEDPLGSEFQSGSIYVLEEVDAAGARQIGCPSARSGDPCAPAAGLPGVTYDTTTFYDSLTLPTTIRLGDDWVVATAATRAGAHTGRYGAMWYLDTDASGSTSGNPATTLPGTWAPSHSQVAALGPLRVLSIEVSQPGAADQDRAYALQLPDGALLELARADVPGGDYAAIRWDDGRTRTVGTTQWGTDVTSGGAFTAGSGALEGTQFSPAPRFDAGQWVRGGVTATGEVVYLPTAANPLVHQIRTAQLDASMTWSDARQEIVDGADTGYPFLTDKAFRDADALYAIQGPDGGWQLRLRADALSLVFDE